MTRLTHEKPPVQPEITIASKAMRGERLTRDEIAKLGARLLSELAAEAKRKLNRR